MIKLVVISHALALKPSRKRWQKLAKDYEIDVTLLIPKEWRTKWFNEKVESTVSIPKGVLAGNLGQEQVYYSEPINEGRYKVVPVDTTDKINWSRYFIKSLGKYLSSNKPDIIYVVHEETTLILIQILLYRKLFSPKSKIIFFSMNALGVPLKKWHQRLRWRWIKRGVEFVFVHYPGIEKCFREAGFEKPIYHQTQIGVDEEVFRPDDVLRREVRERLDLNDKFVIGYAGRLTHEKGLDDLLKTLPLDGVDWVLLLVGNGPMKEEIKDFARSNGYEDRIKLIGVVPLQDMPEYMRAMDCFFIGSKTYPHSVDSFPLVPVQAMACGVPVIGSDCGAIPWQVDDCGLIFPEGDYVALKKHLMTMVSDDALRKDFALRGRDMVLNRFSVSHINKGFFNHIKKLMISDDLKI